MGGRLLRMLLGRRIAEVLQLIHKSEDIPCHVQKSVMTFLCASLSTIP